MKAKNLFWAWVFLMWSNGIYGMAIYFADLTGELGMSILAIILTPLLMAVVGLSNRFFDSIERE